MLTLVFPRPCCYLGHRDTHPVLSLTPWSFLIPFAGVSSRAPTSFVLLNEPYLLWKLLTAKILSCVKFLHHFQKERNEFKSKEVLVVTYPVPIPFPACGLGIRELGCWLLV